MPQSESSARVVNTLLTELDGLDARKGVYVIAATNRPDMIDPAMVRPGRLDKLLYVDLPTDAERAEIVRTMIRKLPLGGDTLDGLSSNNIREEIENLVKEKCEGYSGADLASLVREAGVVALRRTLGPFKDLDDSIPSPTIVVSLSDFLTALDKIGPSVSRAQRRKYEALRSKFAGLPVRVGKEEEHKRVEDDASL